MRFLGFYNARRGRPNNVCKLSHRSEVADKFHPANCKEANMSQKFTGGYSRLQKYASLVDPNGEWRSLQHGCKQYRTDKGATLNYWEKSTKITFQGHPSVAQEFQAAFEVIAARKNRLIDDEDKDLAALQLKNEALQRALVDALRENRRLQRAQKNMSW